jgi:hypothetical protein
MRAKEKINGNKENVKTLSAAKGRAHVQGYFC